MSAESDPECDRERPEREWDLSEWTLRFVISMPLTFLLISFISFCRLANVASILDVALSTGGDSVNPLNGEVPDFSLPSSSVFCSPSLARSGVAEGELARFMIAGE